MTTPINLEEIVPSKAKAWVGLFGSLVTFVLPLILQSSDSLPAPWPVIIGAIAAVLTTLGVYKAPYGPAGTTLAVDPAKTAASSDLPAGTPVAVPVEQIGTTHPISEAITPPPDGNYKHPWK